MTHETVLGWSEITSISLESLDVPITASADPTGTDPLFALGTYSSPAPTTSFQAGEWADTWVDADTPVVARTPILGGSGATLELVSGRKYDLWIKLSGGGETPAWVVGWIRCP